MREVKIKELEEDIADIASHISFKEKRRAQAETVRNYKTCDDLTEELLQCKAKKRYLEKQLKLFMLKDKRAKRRYERLQSDTSSRSTTPMPVSPPISSADEDESTNELLVSPNSSSQSLVDESTACGKVSL